MQYLINKITNKNGFLLLFVFFNLSFSYPLFSADAIKHQVSWDFENATIVPAKKMSNDKLQIKSAAGKISTFYIGYEAGKPADRIAKIVSDPIDPSNKVLHYWLKNASIPGMHKGNHKGRIQLNIGKIKSTEFSQNYRMYLHPDIELYKSYPEQHSWFTIMELWSGQPNTPHRFRISLKIAKEKGIGKPLWFTVSGGSRIGGRKQHGKWQSVWGDINKEFAIPTGEWLDIELGYKLGNEQSGRFYMSVKRENDATKTTLFDITDWTYNPDSPKPIPLTSVNPLKLYAPDRIIDHIRDNGGIAQIYWDDLKMSESWPD